MTTSWVPLQDLLEGLLAGRLTDGPLGLAVMAHHLRHRQFQRREGELLLDPDFPHSVRFGLDTVRASLDALSTEIPALKRNDVHRRLGKLLSALSFDPIEEIVGRDVLLFLANIRGGCRDVHNAIYETCISYPVDHAVSA